MGFTTNKSLNRLLARLPRLARLVKVFTSRGEADRLFYRAYFVDKSPARYKSLFLSSVVFGSAYVKKHHAKPVSYADHRAMALYFLEHPNGPAYKPDALSRDDIPLSFANRLGVPRAPHRRFLAEIGHLPYLASRQGSRQQTAMPLSGKPGAYDFLKPFYDAVRLNEERCRALLEKSIANYALSRYFNTFHPALDVRNLLLHSLTLLRADRCGGRLQNKIPGEVARIFRIPSHSIPHLAIALDLVGLARAGLIDWRELPVSRDVLRLRELSALIDESSEIADFPELVAQASALWMMDADASDTLAQRDGAKRWRASAYDTGFYFNLTRLLYSGRVSVFAQYRSYYDALNSEKSQRALLKHFSRESPTFARWLSMTMRKHPDEFHGIRTRDLANTLFHVWRHRPRPAYEVLTPVAMYTLGCLEPNRQPRSRHTTGKSTRRRPARADRAPHVRTLPLLDQFGM